MHTSFDTGAEKADSDATAERGVCSKVPLKIADVNMGQRGEEMRVRWIHRRFEAGIIHGATCLFFSLDDHITLIYKRLITYINPSLIQTASKLR